ncbi:MAG TPA: ATP-binding protein, partial [Pseudonocardiaceae bacterium]|nr:ATP-binding protein [Pseudonocardiaceae bacterium]
MGEDTPLLRSLRAAVAANQDDVPLRLHLAQLLLDSGLTEEAISHVASALQRVPNSAEARGLMARAMANRTERTEPVEQRPRNRQQGRTPPPVPATPRERQAGDEPTERHSFNWIAAEYQFAGVEQPFIDTGTAPIGPPILYDTEPAQVRLSDVGGMTEVKQRLNAAFLAPMRNPDLRRMYGKNPRGGLLLYGPPGCGKTYLGRAVAGELGARFLALTLADALDMWVGSADRNLREVFAEARRAAPCVVFLDEVDALGHTNKRGKPRAGHRGALNQLLSELDSVNQGGDGVVVLAATNHPWDVD